jgi:hypothetical protein
MLGHRLVVLGNLVALRQIGVEVVLARNRGARTGSSTQRALDRQFHRLAAEHRQRAGQTEADRAHVGVGRRAETGGAPQKILVAVASCTCTSSPITGS